MHLRSLLLASSALAGLGVCFSPADMGGPTATTFQSYDPSGDNYIPPVAVDAMRAAGNVVLDAPPAPAPVEVPAARVVAAVTEAPVLTPTAAPSQSGDPASDSDRIAALEARVSQLDASHNKVAAASDVLTWAEKVLKKYYDRDADKPEPEGTSGDMGPQSV